MTEQNIKNILGQAGFFARYKVYLLILAKIAIAAGMLFYLVVNIKPKEIYSAVQTANLTFVAFAFLLTFLNVFLQYYKWKLTVNLILQENNNSKIWTSMFYGFSAGIFTPARVGEYFGRAIAFKNKSLLQVTLATMIDKFFPFLIITFAGSIAGILFIHFHYHVSFYLTLGIFITVFTLFYFLILLMFNDSFWDNILFTKLRRSIKFHPLFYKVKILRKLDKKYAIKMFLLSAAFYLCFIIQYALLVSAFSNHNNFAEYLWAGNLIMFAKTIIPISLGDLGVREGASVYFIMQIGESASVAFNASIFLFFINVLIPSFIGLLLLLKKNDD